MKCEEMATFVCKNPIDFNHCMDIKTSMSICKDSVI